MPGRAKLQSTKFVYSQWTNKIKKKFKNDGASGRLHFKLDAVRKLKKVLNWCQTRHLEVRFEIIEDNSYRAGWFDDDRTIYIHRDHDPENQLFTLLHECGHWLIKIHTLNYHLINFRESTPTGRINCLENELDAWKRGWELSEKLNLNLDPKKWQRTKTESVNSYLRYWQNMDKFKGSIK